jgi:hypothetical protein
MPESDAARRLNLFDKRFEMFEAVTLFLAMIVSKGKVTRGERIDFVRKTRAARFIFNKEVDDFIAGFDPEQKPEITL